MIETCFGIYMIFAVLAFLFFWGTVVKAQRYDERDERVSPDTPERGSSPRIL